MQRFASTLARLALALALVAAIALPAGAADSADAWTVGIDGMMCPAGCAPTVQSKLESVEGVETVRVDYETKTAVVTTRPGATLTKDACDKALEGTPYTVSRLEPPAAP